MVEALSWKQFLLKTTILGKNHSWKQLLLETINLGNTAMGNNLSEKQPL
jgi:hypothetical protein